MKYALITKREEINKYEGFSDSLEKEYIEYFESNDIVAIPISNYVKDVKKVVEYTCAMKSHFRKSGNQMSGKWKSSRASLLA